LKVSIIVSDDDGNNYRGEVELDADGAGKRPRRQAKAAPAKPAGKVPVNFATPIRNFVKLHARDMSGAQKFALLVAYLTKGDGKKELLMTEVEKNWNRMKPLLGGKFNLAYTTRAKDNGWVDSPKRGFYVVLPGWKGIFDA
jgi:hypothetical protein